MSTGSTAPQYIFSDYLGSTGMVSVAQALRFPRCATKPGEKRTTPAAHPQPHSSTPGKGKKPRLGCITTGRAGMMLS